MTERREREVSAWAESILAGRVSRLQSVEEALGDLEFMQRMLLSGQRGGEEQPYARELQG